MTLSPGQSLLPSRRPIYVPFTEKDDATLEVARWLEEHLYGAAAEVLRKTVMRHQLITLEELKDKDNAPTFNALIIQPPPTQCRIWSNEHRSYWRAGGYGYCFSALHAGVFSLEDAYKRTSHCGLEKGICYEILPTPDPRASLADMPGWKS